MSDAAPPRKKQEAEPSGYARCCECDRVHSMGGPCPCWWAPLRQGSPVAFELAKAVAGFSGTLDGQVKASMALSTGEVVEGVGNTTTEALQRLAVALDLWGAK